MVTARQHAGPRRSASCRPGPAIRTPPRHEDASLRRRRVLALGGLALLLAGASLLVDRTLRFDPEGWLRWGREIALGEGPFDTSGLPSWKPLALVAAVPLAPTGPAAPLLWLLLVRAAGLLGLVGLFALAGRRWGTIAGGVAAALLAVTPAWWTTTAGGGIEPLIVALGCGAVAAHQAGRPGLVLTVLAAMALGREEAVVLVAVYGALLCRRSRWWAAPTAAAVVPVFAAWLGGDWLGSGDPLHGGALARAAGAAEPPLQLGDAGVVAVAVLAPQLLALAGYGAWVAWRAGDRLLTGLAASALGWVAVDLTLVALDYPMPPRFLLPAAAAAAAPVGVGTATLAASALREPRETGSRGRLGADV